ncbi:hypothetical protein HPP92_020888 [Vanilla planifolia]|uniref:Late embryogenesis abundant protein LEA-2 subgroup domain-containing protein n=2 Tax=Vanilla planifolia TaxID=51239 RepID=A0A835UI06_VANPL|nr:hypothetical protein HPP92_020888 [Vanilla planifolia]
MASRQPIMEAIDDDAAALFHSYPSAVYYVQSPSSASLPPSAQSSSPSPPADTLPPPTPAQSCPLAPNTTPSRHGGGVPGVSEDATHRLTLSRYSSSRGSNNSFLNEKFKMCPHENKTRSGGSVMQAEEDIGGDETARRGTRRRGFTEKIVVVSDSNDPLHCVVFQFAWKLLGSLALAVLVFFFATKPPAPVVSFKVVRLTHFSLGEGLDATGVPATVLSCNCSMEMAIDNRSKIFGLHIHPTLLDMSFGALNFASAQSKASYVQSGSFSVQWLFVGVKNKPLYGAGRCMQDLLDSGRGLPLVIRVRSRLAYRVVWDLIKIKHQRHEHCILVLHGMDEPNLQIKVYNSTCIHG